MNKIIKILLSFSLLLSLAACSRKKDTTTDDSKETTTEDTSSSKKVTSAKVVEEETIQAAAFAFLSQDTQCTQDLLSVTYYDSPAVAVHFYDVDEDGQVELMVMACEGTNPYTYLIYEYNSETGGFDLDNYFTNDPGLDDGYPMYSNTRKQLFTFAVVENDEGMYDCLIDYWSNDEEMTATREVYITGHSDGTYEYTFSNWDGSQWVEEENKLEEPGANSWKDDAGDYVVLEPTSVSDFVSQYE